MTLAPVADIQSPNIGIPKSLNSLQFDLPVAYYVTPWQLEPMLTSDILCGWYSLRWCFT